MTFRQVLAAGAAVLAYEGAMALRRFGDRLLAASGKAPPRAEVVVMVGTLGGGAAGGGAVRAATPQA